MRAGAVGRSDGMDHSQMPFIVDGLQRRKRGMKAEKSIEVDSRRFGVTRPRRRHRNLRSHDAIAGVAEGCHHRDAVSSTALEYGNENRPILAASGGSLRLSSPNQELWGRCKTHHGQARRLQEVTS